MVKTRIGCEILIALLSMKTLCLAQNNNSTSSYKVENETSDLVLCLLNKSNPHVRPRAGGPPVDVKVDIYVISLGSISEVNMSEHKANGSVVNIDFTVDISLRQRWKDDRLAYDKPFEFVKLTGSSISQVWTPDIYFPFEKRAMFHDVTVPNRLLKIQPTGDVLFSVRHDSYEESEMTLSWLDEDPVERDADLELPEMTLKEVRTRKCLKIYKTGAFPCLAASFILKRRYGFFILQTFAPSILIVILSWISFLINFEAVPARISLGVTTVLTMTTQLSGSKGSIPKVSYPKAIDVWMSMCMIFVFAALLEFAIVNAISRRERKDQFKAPKHRTRRQDKDLEQNDPLCKNPGRCSVGRQKAQLIDDISRVLFPVLFTIFNIAYWSVYLTQPDPEKN